MERFNKGLKAYWKRRAYERLDAPVGRRWWRRRVDRAELGEGRRRGFRIRIRIRVWRRLRKATPTRILAWIRKEYVRMALGTEMSATTGGYGAWFGTATPRRMLTSIRDGYVRMMLGLERSATIGGHGAVYGTSTEKEYDERVLVAIYRALA